MRKLLWFQSEQGATVGAATPIIYSYNADTLHICPHIFFARTHRTPWCVDRLCKMKIPLRAFFSTFSQPNDCTNAALEYINAPWKLFAVKIPRNCFRRAHNFYDAQQFKNDYQFYYYYLSLSDYQLQCVFCSAIHSWSDCDGRKFDARIKWSNFRETAITVWPVHVMWCDRNNHILDAQVHRLWSAADWN